MEPLRCLYVDDDERRQSRYKAWFERAWRQAYPLIPLEMRVLESADEALEELQHNAINYDLLIADIMFGTQKEKLGFAVIEQGRSSDHLAIVAFSIQNGEFEKTALARGADAFLSKQKLLDGEIALPEIAAQLTKAIRKRKHFDLTPEVVVHYDRENWALVSLLLELGEQNVVEFMRAVIEKPIASVEIRYVKSGFSGAIVLRVDAEVAVPLFEPRQERSILLKVSKDYGLLVSELAKYKETDFFPAQLFVSADRDSVLQHEEWYALGIKFMDASDTLLDWLLSAAPSTSILENTCSQLFLDGGLGEVYRKGRLDSDARMPDVAQTHFHPKRIALIEQGLVWLSTLCGRHDPGRYFDHALLRDYLYSKRVGIHSKESLPRGSITCRLHGDLHGRNILVTQHGRPVLIDPANVGLGHWAGDIARLLVDLFLVGWDYGTESHEWTHMKEWQEAGTSLVVGSGLDASNANTPIRDVLLWVRSHLHEIVPPAASTIYDWEFAAAMAAEFMRAAFREDLPTPKRVLGITLSSWSLKESSRLLATGP